MWTWLVIVVLARVLMASNEMDNQYPSTISAFTDDRIAEECGDGEELQGDESSRESTAKPEIQKSRIVEWKENEIFRDINPYENSIASLIGELSSSGSKIFSKIPKEAENEKDKRSSVKESEISPSGTLMSWITLKNKAHPYRNTQDPWQEIKKSRAFSPWGGKRVTVFGQGPKVRRPIRVPFNSWGGKRSFSDAHKRARFSSWGGKRGWYLGADENSVENGLEKRTKFNAWGGKRSKNGDRDDEEIKRNRFNAWGGKRNDNTDKRTPTEVEAKKRVFNAWGGKRFSTGDDQVNSGDEKEVKYGSWYEKEGNNNNNNKYNNNNNDNMFNVEKPGDRVEVLESINSLVDENDDEEIETPSESEIIELPEKKGAGGRTDYIHKSLFNPWGGKKRGENDLDEIGRSLNFILPESHHHHRRFWPWGG